jgi:uncharacterized membrane protein YhiD involved in acid resistance|tara:strand:+ start:6929 stop:7609 length:681 start_codon:yes stop_codon:yes gene_type:complete
MNELTAFRDLLKNSVLETSFVSSLNSSDIFINLLITLVIGVFIFYIYKKTFQGVLYTQAFNVSLVMVSLVTALIIMTISSNLILSLGMVGALSIVRFRTAVKDSMDIVYMFWAISVGIANGAGYFKISLIGSLFIAAVLIVLSRYRESSNPYLLIINYNQSGEEPLKDHMKKIGSYKLKSKTVTPENTELTIEIRTDNDHQIVSDIQKINGVKDCVLVSYNGDYVS